MASSKPQRVLVVRNDRLGDTILSLPVLTALRKHLPDAHLAWLAHPSVAGLLQATKGIDELLLDDGRSTAASLAQRLKQGRFDAALVLNTNTRNAQAVWRAQIAKRILWHGKLAGRLLGNANVRVRRSHPPIHETRFALAFVQQLIEQPIAAPPAPLLHIPPAVMRRVGDRLRREFPPGRPLFAVHPGNRRSAFNWPVFRYAELVRELSRFGNVLVTGGPNESELVHEVIALAGGRGTPVYGLSLIEFSALVSQLSVLVASSTGPMHLAGWLNTPAVCLFSRHPVQVPEKWAPLGDRHTIIQPPLPSAGDRKLQCSAEQMELIGIEPVLKAALSWLDKSRLARTSSVSA